MVNIVLVFRSMIKLFLGKLKSKLRGLYWATKVFLYGVLELENKDGQRCKMHGQRVKKYLESIKELKIVCDMDLDGT